MLPHFLANQWQFPHSGFGCLVPCCQFTWTELLRAAVPRVILLWPTLKHVQCTEKTLGAGIKLYESLKTETFSHVPRILYPEQFWMAFHGNCKKVLQGHKFQFLALSTSLFQGKYCCLRTVFFARFDFTNGLSSFTEILQEFSAFIKQLTWKLPD